MNELNKEIQKEEEIKKEMGALAKERQKNVHVQALEFTFEGDKMNQSGNLPFGVHKMSSSNLPGGDLKLEILNPLKKVNEI